MMVRGSDAIWWEVLEGRRVEAPSILVMVIVPSFTPMHTCTPMHTGDGNRAILPPYAHMHPYAYW